MRLYAISDLHLANEANRVGLLNLRPFPDDWLVLAGDVGETEAQLHFALQALTARFRQVLWVPGNHDLWTIAGGLRGEAKYRQLVEICRGYGVLTPEDRYPLWPGRGPEVVLAPLFLHYDYSFRPAHVRECEAVQWAIDSGVLASDEHLLHPTPYRSMAEWCAARVRYTAERLARAAGEGRELILINHYPLREDLVTLRRIPRFSIWCGTRATEDWHLRFRAAAVVYGHLHIKGTHFRDGVRFEEVSLGYPRDWDQDLGVAAYLRQILPHPETPLAKRRRGPPAGVDA